MKKQKLIALGMSALLVVSMVGCGKAPAGSDGKEQTSTESTMQGESGENTEAGDVTTDTSEGTESAPAEDGKVTVTVSEKGYESLGYAGKVEGVSYFVFQENDLYGLMDEKENVIIEPEYMAYVGQLENDHLAFVTKKEDGIFESILCTADGKVLKTLEGEYFFRGENEGLAWALNPEGNIIFYSAQGEGDEAYQEVGAFSPENIPGYEGCGGYRRGMAIFRNSALVDGQIINYAKYDEATKSFTLHTFEDELLGTFNVPVSEDGWTAATDFKSLSTDEEQFLADYLAYGGYRSCFYNVDTGEKVYLPADFTGIEMGTVDNGMYVYEAEGYCLVMDGNEQMRLFSLETGDYVNTTVYTALELGNPSGLELFSTPNGNNWGYLAPELGYGKVGPMYKDATAMTPSGYAMILQDGMQYIIHRDEDLTVYEPLQIISEAFEGTGGYVLGDVSFAVRQSDESIHLAIVELE